MKSLNSIYYALCGVTVGSSVFITFLHLSCFTTSSPSVLTPQMCSPRLAQIAKEYADRYLSVNTIFEEKIQDGVLTNQEFMDIEDATSKAILLGDRYTN